MKNVESPTKTSPLRTTTRNVLRELNNLDGAAKSPKQHSVTDEPQANSKEVTNVSQNLPDIVISFHSDNDKLGTDRNLLNAATPPDVQSSDDEYVECNSTFTADMSGLDVNKTIDNVPNILNETTQLFEQVGSPNIASLIQPLDVSSADQKSITFDSVKHSPIENLDIEKDKSLDINAQNQLEVDATSSKSMSEDSLISTSFIDSINKLSIRTESESRQALIEYEPKELKQIASEFVSANPFISTSLIEGFTETSLTVHCVENLLNRSREIARNATYESNELNQTVDIELCAESRQRLPRVVSGTPSFVGNSYKHIVTPSEDVHAVATTIKEEARQLNQTVEVVSETPSLLDNSYKHNVTVTDDVDLVVSFTEEAARDLYQTVDINMCAELHQGLPGTPSLVPSDATIIEEAATKLNQSVDIALRADSPQGLLKVVSEAPSLASNSYKQNVTASDDVVSVEILTEEVASESNLTVDIELRVESPLGLPEAVSETPSLFGNSYKHNVTVTDDVDLVATFTEEAARELYQTVDIDMCAELHQGLPGTPSLAPSLATTIEEAATKLNQSVDIALRVDSPQGLLKVVSEAPSLASNSYKQNVTASDDVVSVEILTEEVASESNLTVDIELRVESPLGLPEAVSETPALFGNSYKHNVTVTDDVDLVATFTEEAARELYQTVDIDMCAERHQGLPGTPSLAPSVATTIEVAATKLNQSVDIALRVDSPQGLLEIVSEAPSIASNSYKQNVTASDDVVSVEILTEEVASELNLTVDIGLCVESQLGVPEVVSESLSLGDTSYQQYATSSDDVHSVPTIIEGSEKISETDVELSILNQSRNPIKMDETFACQQETTFIKTNSVITSYGVNEPNESTDNTEQTMLQQIENPREFQFNQTMSVDSIEADEEIRDCSLDSLEMKQSLQQQPLTPIYKCTDTTVDELFGNKKSPHLSDMFSDSSDINTTGLQNENTFRVSSLMTSTKNSQHLSTTFSNSDQVPVNEINKTLDKLDSPSKFGNTFDLSTAVIEKDNAIASKNVDKGQSPNHFKITSCSSSSVSKMNSQEIGAGDDGRFMVLNSNDFDFLQSRGGSTIDPEEVRRSSLLLNFDPLLRRSAYTTQLSAPAEIIEDFGDGDKSLHDTELPLDLYSNSSGEVTSSVEIQKHPSTALSTVTNETAMSVGLVHDSNTMDNDSNAYVNNIKTEDKQMPVDGVQLNEKNINFEYSDVNIQKKMEEYETTQDILMKRITDKEKTLSKNCAIIEAYEKALAELVAEKEKITDNYEVINERLRQERDIHYQHLMSLENTFSDLHMKYERSKEFAVHLQERLDVIAEEKSKVDELLKQQESRYEKMKLHALHQLEYANATLEDQEKNNSRENSRLKALLKIEEVSRNTIQEQLVQKSKENDELVKICDELIGGQKS